jgi:hypothetical protein
VIFLLQPAHSCGEVFCVSDFTSSVILTPETYDVTITQVADWSRDCCVFLDMRFNQYRDVMITLLRNLKVAGSKHGYMTN